MTTPIRQIVPFVIDGRRFGLPLSRVERVVRAVDVTPLPDAPDIVMGVINAGGDIIPVFDIRRRLGLPFRHVNLNDSIIIFRASKRNAAVLVDSVSVAIPFSEDELIPAEQVVPEIEFVNRITVGIIRFRDGMIMISDIDKFLSLEEQGKLDEAISRRL